MSERIPAGEKYGFSFPTNAIAQTKATLTGATIKARDVITKTEHTAGVTLTVDVNSRTGDNHVELDTSADGTAYAAGKTLEFVITAGTVDSISVAGEIVGRVAIGPVRAVDNDGNAIFPAASYTAPNNAGITTILDRLGGFTGSGINTILGFLRAIMRKDASVPSDVGGTYAASERSLEAISEAVDAIDVDGGAGTGANAVVLTILDIADDSPLEHAKVRVTQGMESYLATADVNGEATFNLDNATWTVRVTKPGYTLAAQSLVVNGAEAETYKMTAVVVAQPANPDLVAHAVLCTGLDGEPEAGVEVHYRMTRGTGDAGYSRDSAIATATSDADGYATLTFIVGATYKLWRGDVDRMVDYVAGVDPPTETLGNP